MTYSLLLIGTGEGGGRIAQAFLPLGYTVCAINTAQGDLDGLTELDSAQKLLLKISQGGTGKNPLLVKEALTVPAQRTALRSFIEQQIQNHPSPDLLYVLICVGGGGGSGSGLANVVLETVLEFNVPVGMIYTLPGRVEDVVAKNNALGTFRDIYNSKAVNAAVSPLILVDNDYIMDRQGIPLKDFYTLSNQKIAQVIHQFNSFASLPSKYLSAVDTLDLGRLLGLGGVCSFGRMRITNPVDLEAVKAMLSSGLFVQGVNIQSAKGAAVIVQAPEWILSDQLISNCVNFLFEEVARIIGGGIIFRGVYEDPQAKSLEVSVVFNGMTFPQDRFNEMWEDIRVGRTALKEKQTRFDHMSYDVQDDLMPSQTFQKVVQGTKSVWVTCTNCLINPLTKLSRNEYNGRGPMAFTKGQRCPQCAGRGKFERSVS